MNWTMMVEVYDLDNHNECIDSFNSEHWHRINDWIMYKWYNSPRYKIVIRYG